MDDIEKTKQQLTDELNLLRTRNVEMENDILGLNREIMELREDINVCLEDENSHKEREERFRLLLESINEVIYSLDKNGIITFISPVVERISQYKVNDLVGKNFSIFVHPEDCEALKERLFGMLYGETAQHEYRIFDKDKSIRYVKTSVRKKIIDGEFCGLTGVLTDITELIMTGDALKESREKLKLKLNSILSPDTDIIGRELENILDAPSIQSIMEDFSIFTGMAVGIRDLKGNVIIVSGWQEICTKYHRVNEETYKNCVESDLFLAGKVSQGEYLIYKCKNKLWDIVIPLYIGDKHVGNIYTGQFFL